ncbi:MAG TPA: MarR family transcriptional regulator, partial [Archangium sp.]
ADEALDAWRAFLNAHALITRRVSRDLADAGLPDLSWYDLLWALYRQPRRALRVNELAREVVLSPTAMSRFVDRVEKAGHVRREADPDDRRRLRMVLTEAGLAVSQQVRQALTSDLAAQFATASPAELKELGRALDLVERALGALEQRMPSPPEGGELEDEEVRSTQRRRVPPASSGSKK